MTVWKRAVHSVYPEFRIFLFVNPSFVYKSSFISYFITLSLRIAELMDCDFTSLLQVFQSYHDDGRTMGGR